jgi:hypothetical protein
MWWEGKELWGRVQIAETDAGNTLKGLLKSGFKLGISSRGVGSVKSEGGRDIVQDDFELIAFDYVSNPSTPGAYLFKEGYMRPLKGIQEQSISKRFLAINVKQIFPNYLFTRNLIRNATTRADITRKSVPRLSKFERCS